MADNIIIGAIKAILSLDDTGFTTGLAAAETSVAKFKYSSDQMIAGMSAAGKEATASAQMIAGMSAAGQQAAAGMEQAASGVSTLAANFGKMAAAVGGLFVIDKVVGSVIEFGREAVETASHIVDLSNKTGLSVESIQRMSFVAEQAGGSLEGFTTAAFKLGVNIEGGSKSVTEAVNALGLSLEALRAMKPDEQFETIVAALGKIDDAQLRNRLGVELFGKSFAQIAGAVAEGYDKIADKAAVSTDAQLKAIDDLADEWNAFYDTQVKKALSVLGELAHGWTDAAKAQKMAADMTNEQRDIYMTLLTQMEQGVKTMDLSTAAAIALGKGFDVALPPSRTTDAKSFVQQLAEIDASVAALTVSQREEIVAGLALGKSAEDLETKFNLADGTLKRFTATQREQEAAAKKAAEEQNKYNQSLGDLTDKQIIQAVTEGLKAGTQWLELNTTAAEKAALAFAKLHPLLESVVEDFSRIDMSGLGDQAIALHGPLDDINDELERMHEATTSKIDLSGVFGEIHTESEQAVIDFQKLVDAESAAKEKSHETAEGMRAIGQSFMELGQIFTNSDLQGVFAGAGLFMKNMADFTEHGVPEGFANKAAAVAQGALAIWESTDSASAGVNALNGAMAGAGAGMAFGPYGAAVGAAAGALVGLVKASENAKQEIIAGNEILEQWTHTMAGMFDEVGSAQDKAFAGTSEQLKTIALVTRTYEDLGFTAEETTAVIEKLWEAQDLGPDAVKLVLDEINDQMERHAEIMKKWADGVNTYIEGFATRVEGFGMGLDSIRQKQEDVNSVTEITKQRYDDAVQAMDELKASGTASQEAITKATEDAHNAWMAYQNAQISGAVAMGDSLVGVQEQFDILQQYAVTAFETTISQGGSLIEAMAKIHEPLTTLQQAMKDFGLEGSATFTKLTEIDGVIQANKDIFTSIDGLNQMMKGLGDATLLTQEDMDLFGKDAVSLFDTLVKRMEDHGTPAAEAMNTAMLLMQPTLQTLWEGQEKFGLKIDGATQELLDQAVKAGLVGEQHKTIQAQILTAIEGVEAAILRLPSAFAASFANADTLLSKLQTIGTAAGQIQIGLGASTGTGGVATSLTDVQNDLTTRWKQMYGPDAEIPPDVKHAQNQAFIQQGVEPPWPGFKKGGMVSDWLQSMYGPGAVPVVAHVGEGILNPFATAAIGGKSGLDAMNTNPWAAVQRMASMQMPSPTGTASAPMSSGGMTIGDINITVHAPGGDPQAVARATKSAFDEWYDEVESGRGASRYRRLHQQVVVT